MQQSTGSQPPPRTPAPSLPWARLFARLRGQRPIEAPPIAVPDPQCADLQERLAATAATLRERTGLLYETQRQFSTEHFEFQETMRELKLERLRLAGVTADRDLMLARQQHYLKRIAALKGRLRAHEPCDDEWIDESLVPAP